jgi:hypothetical protein
MGDTKARWSREYYEAGGADPFLFYVIYGPVRCEVPLSQAKYRCKGVPQGLETTAHELPGPEMIDAFRRGFLWEQLVCVEPELASAVAACRQFWIVKGSVGDPPDLSYLRDAVGLVTYLLDCGGVSVFDPQMFRWWSAKDWRELVFEPDAPVPQKHTTLLVSEEPDGTEWVHSRGLRKFGRSDLSVHNVPATHREAVLDLCNRFIEYQIQGGLIPEGQEIRVGTLPAGMLCHHQGCVDDPEFNNVHVEIAWPGAPKKQPDASGATCACGHSHSVN